MNIEFERKYTVIKDEDILKYLAPSELNILSSLEAIISKGRKRDGKKDNTYLVVNTDESYATDIARILQQHGHFSPGGSIAISIPEVKEIPFEQARVTAILIDTVNKINDYAMDYQSLNTDLAEVSKMAQECLALISRPDIIENKPNN